MVVANKVKLLKRSHLICHKEQTRLKNSEWALRAQRREKKLAAAAVEGKLYEIKCI